VGSQHGLCYTPSTSLIGVCNMIVDMRLEFRLLKFVVVVFALMSPLFLTSCATTEDFLTADQKITRLQERIAVLEHQVKELKLATQGVAPKPAPEAPVKATAAPIKPIAAPAKGTAAPAKPPVPAVAKGTKPAVVPGKKK
jgi:hypothetical protein